MARQPGDKIVPLNTCYAVECECFDDARALAALLNSPLAAAWLNVLAEPARGGYHRYLGWTMSLLPLRKWERARRELAPLCTRAMSGDVPTDAELLEAALAAYGLSVEELEPLLSWERPATDWAPRRFARASRNLILGEHPVDITLGDVALHPHQLSAVSRIRMAFREFGGALLCGRSRNGQDFRCRGDRANIPLRSSSRPPRSLRCGRRSRCS